MRNLKRALSLALASVMLLGMMVVGSSAAFADADKISNDEAVGIAAALGLFAGYEENGVTNFKPEETVTRAQMAAIIAKMYFGDLNADTYKGGNKFTDTASFEGGWAEGYINLGVEKGWFKGYGDGTFKPGQAVTTAEAMTMIINLLKIDAGEGTWPMTVMAAVEENKLFNDTVELKPAPATNAAMTRDQLAVAVVNGLWYSAEGVQGYKYGDNAMVFKTWSDAAEYGKEVATTAAPFNHTLITEVKGDTLADTVFEVVETKDVIVGNQATGLDCTEFASGLMLDIETGKDMLGHTVKAMYAKKGQYVNEKNRGIAYGVVDTADYYTVANDIAGDKKAFTAVFGGKIKEAAAGVNAYTFDGIAYGKLAAADYDENASVAKAGTYGVDKESGEIVTYIDPVKFTVGQVGYIKTVADKEAITLNGKVYQNNADLDVIEAYEGVAEDDIVVVIEYQVNAARDEGMVYIEKLEPVEGKIEAKKTAKLNGKNVNYVTISGKDYLVPATAITVDGNVDANITTTYTPDTTAVYNVYAYGETLIGVEQITGAGNLEDAIFVVKSYSADVASGYGQTVKHFYAQGVNAKGEEVTTLIGIEGVSEDCSATDVDCVAKSCAHVVRSLAANTFYTFEKSLDREQAKKDVMTATKAYTVAQLNGNTNGYFAEEITIATTLALSEDDKYLSIGAGAANRLYLTDATKFILVETPATTVDELKMATYTGAISKNLVATDTLVVAGVVDANGSQVAELVVIVTADLGLAIEDYVYITADSVYSETADGYKYNNVYFTETEEFKDGVVLFDDYANGFYEIVDIDEETGVYTLKEVAYTSGMELKGAKAEAVYGNNLILAGGDNDMYALAEDVKIFDVRSEETLDTAEVGEITSLKGIAAAIKGKIYEVTFDLLLEEVEAGKFEISHIFVKEVK